MFSRRVCLLHDNAWPHSTHVTTALLEKFKLDILDHPPYSLDFAPSDFHLFLRLKKHLAAKKFDDGDVVLEDVMTWFKWQTADFYDSGIQKLVPRLNPLTPNDLYMSRTAPLTSKRCILYIYSTNVGAEYFKHALYSPFFSLQNAACFIMITYLVPVLFTFYMQSVLKLKKNNSGAKGLINIWTMPATVMKNKVMYRQFIHSVGFVN